MYTRIRLNNSVVTLTSVAGNELLVELKLIGLIESKKINDCYNIEIQLKNNRYKIFNASEEVKDFFICYWLDEVERRHKESIRCTPGTSENDKSKEPKKILSEEIFEKIAPLLDIDNKLERIFDQYFKKDKNGNN